MHLVCIGKVLSECSSTNVKSLNKFYCLSVAEMEHINIKQTHPTFFMCIYPSTLLSVCTPVLVTGAGEL